MFLRVSLDLSISTLIKIKRISVPLIRKRSEFIYFYFKSFVELFFEKLSRIDLLFL